MITAHQTAETEAMLLRQVRRAGAISRVELARAIGITPSTVGTYVQRLLAGGYLREGSRLPGERGRPATQVKLNPAAGFMIGMDFTHHYVRVVSLDFTERVLAQERSWITDAIPLDVVLDTALLLARTCARHGRGELLGIGISVPHPGERAPRYLCQWDSERVVAAVGEAFTKEPRLANSALALAAAELWFGAGRKVPTFVSLEGRACISAGIVADGRLLALDRPGTGMIGHWLCPEEILPESLRRADMRVLSLNRLASIPGLLDGCRLALQNQIPSQLRDVTGELLFTHLREAWLAGDTLAGDCVDAAARALGWAVSRLSDLVAPELVIVSYPLATLGQRFLDRISQAAHEQAAAASPIAAPRIVASILAEHAGAIGAAAVALHHWRP